MTLAEQLKESRASVEVTRRREAAALSELAQYDASNERRVEHVQALLAAAASSSVNGTEAYRENGARGGAGPGSIVGAATTTRGAEIGPERSARVGGTALSELAALGEAIADRGREVADLKVGGGRGGCLTLIGVGLPTTRTFSLFCPAGSTVYLTCELLGPQIR